ncbi:MAG TPA: hypothetical protein VFR24_14580 [Candidatus Angelobacter sp.]|nr:hypothetical protein [Candidatus Angelobacter sp.]
MGFKLVEKIQLMKHVPSKYKRILMAVAQRSRNDGTNFYESKETIAGKASSSRWTVYRNLEDLIRAAVVVKAESHECSKEGCTKGTRHLVGNGHWTQAYNIDLATLQNATWLDVVQCSKTAKVQCSKTPNSHVAKCDAIQGCDAATLGNDDSSVLTDGLSVSKQVGFESSLRSDSTKSDAKKENPEELGSKRTLPSAEDTCSNCGWVNDGDSDGLEFHQTYCVSTQTPKRTLPSAETYPWWEDIHDAFGAGASLNPDPELWERLNLALIYFGWDGRMLRGCIEWAMAHKFWKTRIMGFESFVNACDRCTQEGGPGEKGIMPQYVRHLNLMRTKAAKGTHAAINPELHTGRDAQGRSWVGQRCRVCDMVMTDNEDQVCDDCKKTKTLVVAAPQGFDVEEA